MAIVFSVYGNTLNHDYNLDDSYYVNILPKVDAKPNEIVKVVTKRFSKSDYRPIPALHLAIEQYCFGQKSSVFHFFNVFYYALLGIAIFILFNQLKIFPNQWMVLLLVILFLVHPSHSNVVASIKNRDVILSMFYGVLAIICFVRFYDVKKYLYLLSSALLLLIAILCKRDALMFLFIALGVVHFSRSINWRKALIPVAVSFFLVVSFIRFKHFFYSR
ncbi:MAG: hypothetical protein R2753_12640 [Chitinophagales bacterium]